MELSNHGELITANIKSKMTGQGNLPREEELFFFRKPTNSTAFEQPKLFPAFNEF